MEKRGRAVLVLSIAILIVFVILLFFYFALFNPNSSKSENGTPLLNPAANLTTEEAIAKFDSSFVKYVLYTIKAYNLHNPPLSDDYPKIEFKVDQDIYSAVIQNSVIKVSENSVVNPDIRIRTTKEEAVRMVKDQNYVQQSFLEGKSEIDLLASKTTLFAKGYLGLYTGLTGKSVTGNVLRIYLD